MTTTYVAVLPGGLEHFGELTDEQIRRESKRTNSGQVVREFLLKLGDEAMSKHNLKSPRKDTVQITVKFYRFDVTGGKLNKLLVTTANMQPPLERMTEEEFQLEMAMTLMALPGAFRSWVSGYAWEHSHAAGREEVVETAKDIVHGLGPCIKQYYEDQRSDG